MTTTTLPTTEDFYTEPYPGRKGAEVIVEDCGKCSGTGSVSWGIDVSARLHNIETGKFRDVPKVCFDCHGIGRISFTVKSARARFRRHAKQQAETARKVAEAEAKRETNRAEFTASNGDVVEIIATLNGGFGESLREQFDTTGKLSDNQVEAVRRIAAEQANTAPVAEGRAAITGKVVSTKWHESQYGETLKMVVQDDRGFRVWGTVPQALMPSNYFDENGGYHHEHGVGCGGPDSNHEMDEPIRVTFTATVTASDDDETFGFYKRPAKAEVL